MAQAKTKKPTTGQRPSTAKKVSKNAIENRNKTFVDPRGEPVMVMTLGKKQMAFFKDGVYKDKNGKVLEL
jgi:hypothetical protein